MEANKYPLKKAAFNLVLVYMMCFIFLSFAINIPKPVPSRKMAFYDCLGRFFKFQQE